MATAQVGLFWPKPAQQVSPVAWLRSSQAQAAWPSKPGPAQYTKNQDTVASIYFIHFEERLSGCLCVQCVLLAVAYVAVLSYTSAIATTAARRTKQLQPGAQGATLAPRAAGNGGSYKSVRDLTKATSWSINKTPPLH